MVLEHPLSREERLAIVRRICSIGAQQLEENSELVAGIVLEYRLGRVLKLPNGRPFDRIFFSYEESEIPDNNFISGVNLGFAWGDIVAPFEILFTFDDDLELLDLSHKLSCKGPRGEPALRSPTVYSRDVITDQSAIAALCVADGLLALCESAEAENVDILPDSHQFCQQLHFYDGPGESNGCQSRW